VNMEKKHNKKVASYDSVVCTRDMIGDHVDTGRLYICPPMEHLHIYNFYEYFPQKHIEFVIRPNYEIETDESIVNEEVNNFEIARE
jgi:hypothetical protein